MRKPVAILLMLAFMALWVWGAATIGSRLTDAPSWLQLVFYVVAGIGWVFPLRPLFLWMNANQPPEED
jgi:predicted membrane channel-forming protein YqfA (hemolysin III family)